MKKVLSLLLVLGGLLLLTGEADAHGYGRGVGHGFSYGRGVGTSWFYGTGNYGLTGASYVYPGGGYNYQAPAVSYILPPPVQADPPVQLQTYVPPAPVVYQAPAPVVYYYSYPAPVQAPLLTYAQGYYSGSPVYYGYNAGYGYGGYGGYGGVGYGGYSYLRGTGTWRYGGGNGYHGGNFAFRGGRR